MNNMVYYGEYKRVGEMLVNYGKLEQVQLDRALSHQANVSSRIGEILITLGFVSEEDLVEVLGEQLSLSMYEPDPEDVFLPVDISELFHREHPFAMISRGEEGQTILLVSNPLDGDLFAAMGVLTTRDYVVQLTLESNLKNIMAEHYGLEHETVVGNNMFVDESDIDRLKDMASEAPVIKYVNGIIDTAVSRKASDIHLEPHEEGLQVRLRIDGILQDYDIPPHSMIAAIISRIKLMAALDIAERRLPQDGKIGMRISGKEIDLRVSTLPTVHGEGIVIRILEKGSAILNLEFLGMQADTEKKFRNLLKIQDGIILVTGPTGSGKTTTLYCALNQISNESNKIITIEDPVEYQLKGINQIQVRPEINLTFAKGLRSIVRQDPDVIMIGEIRDLETAEIAVQSSLTGHLVFSTLHTNDALSAVVRMVDLGVERFLLVSSLRGVMAQRLVRRICEHCKEKRGLASEALGYMPGGEDFYLFEGRGCKKCGNSGFTGRVGLYEFLVIDDALSRGISHGADLVELKKIAADGGFRTMYDDGLEKVRDGVTSLAEVVRVTGK
ncbi:MAG: Flp pilus assembly complex ATPase component TadA [Proteobacteria bacterium]|nr:Flp pilus assembly complex ATPase component TadA [Pseudomonadota bacterium]MBU1737291.1 Flp pilus assembly complex ATPase component TadA [Pseudomonadota bacterium]